jgi:OmpA-OmpF porin, OOP family
MQMRLFVLGVGLGFIPVTALAQETVSRSSEEIVCALTGECETAAETDAAESTETLGKPRARTSSTRGFSLAKPKAPADKAAGSSAPNVKRASNAVPGTPSGKKAVAASKPQTASRLDLRLTFELGSAVLTERGKAEARVFAQALKMPALASRRFVIEGHTDSQGDREANLDLSRRRAEAVADYLSSLGVARERLEVRGYGPDRPLSGRSPRDEANRRVEAVLLS